MATRMLPGPRGMATAAAPILGLGTPGARAAAALTLLVAAVLSPNLPLPGGLPAVRLEQLLLLLLLPGLVRHLVRDPSARATSMVDVGFAALTLAIAVSVVAAPRLVPEVGSSPRDLFQILRPMEYWLLYRLGRTSGAGEPGARRFVRAMVVLGILEALFASVQVVAPAAVNRVVTGIWTGADHNLAGVIENGRAVGTVGNANVFGIVEGWFLLVVLAAVLVGLGSVLDRGGPWGAIVLVVISAGVVSTQSRSASLSILGAAVIGMLAVAAIHRRPGALAPLGALLLGAAAAFGIQALVPHAAGSIASRFDPNASGSDASVVERLVILRYAFAPRERGSEQALVCDGAPMGTVAAAHAPAGEASVALSIEEQVVIAAARRLEASYCATGRWPTPADHPDVPSAALKTGRVDSAGYLLALPASGGDPPFAVTSHPNLLLDPSFESSDAGGGWHAAPGSTLTAGSPRYGAMSGRARIEPGGYVDQFVLYSFPADADFTLSLWARSADGRPASFGVRLDAWLTGGDSLAAVGRAVATLPADGRWVRLQTAVHTPAAGRIWAMRIVLSAPDATAPSTVELDGAELHRGSVPASFPFVRDVDPSVLPSVMPSYWESPLVGVGPMSNVDFGSVDNEYALILLRFGVVGLAAFLLLVVAALRSALLGWRDARGPAARALALGLCLALLATGVFTVAAGTYYAYQAAAILWLWVGVVGARERRSSGSSPQVAEATEARVAEAVG